MMLVATVPATAPAVVARTMPATGAPSVAVLQLGLLCNVERMDDAQIAGALPQTTIFARVSPDQKSRIIRIQQKRGADVTSSVTV
ncbi:MAG: hypothetical protein ABSA52_13240 [Candidatus Binatia bacterium]